MKHLILQRKSIRSLDLNATILINFLHIGCLNFMYKIICDQINDLINYNYDGDFQLQV
jgi:hypothetical protein